MSSTDALKSEIEHYSRPLEEPKDLAPLIERVSRARVVMLGEATHGTADFYEWRRMITEWLIVKHGFRVIAVEGDWPDISRIDRYTRLHEGSNAREILEEFRRWPTWMWGNTEILRLAEWLRSHNENSPPERKVGMYGLDIYSLFDSAHAVLRYLESTHPILARRARVRYGCFDPYRHDEIAYARAAHTPFFRNCQAEVVETLQDLLKLRLEKSERDGEPLFDARQNARVVQSAERYYRILIQGNNRSWNVRDRHMLDTLDLLLQRQGEQAGSGSRAVVWAHNSHIGDYRSTDMRDEGLVNLGGMARERYGEDQVALVGFGTYEGRVIASHAWDGPLQELTVPPARSGSIESAFHEIAQADRHPGLFAIFNPELRASSGELTRQHPHRAIGVVYDPEHERWGNYLQSALATSYDAFIYVDRSSALNPLILPFEAGEIPETFPAGQ